VRNRGGFVTAGTEESSLDQVDEESCVSARLGPSVALWSCRGKSPIMGRFFKNCY